MYQVEPYNPGKPVSDAFAIEADMREVEDVLAAIGVYAEMVFEELGETIVIVSPAQADYVANQLDKRRINWNQY